MEKAFYVDIISPTGVRFPSSGYGRDAEHAKQRIVDALTSEPCGWDGWTVEIVGEVTLGVDSEAG